MGSVELEGGPLEYRWIEGDPRREPLVFLHEGLGCVAMWARFPDAVAALTGRAAMVYSRYGYGGSAPLASPRSPAYLHEEADRVLPDLLDRLSLRRPLLVGHSDGASIALLYASAHPTAGVVAMAPHVFVERVTLDGIAAAEARFASGELARRLARYHDDPGAAFHSWAGVWRSPEFANWDIGDRLVGVRCPVLLVQGENDQYGTRRQLDVAQRQLGGRVERLELPGCGHSPHLERPAEVEEAIGGFTETLAATH